MKTSQIRDKLMEKKTLYVNSLNKSKEAIAEIKQTIDSVTGEQKEMLASIGVNFSVIESFDLERMQQDEEYLGACDQKLQAVITQLHEYLERELDV